MYEVKQNGAGTPLLFVLVSTVDGTTPVTGATPTVTISKNGGAFAAPAGAVSEVANGVYKVAGNAADANTLGPLWLHATAALAQAQDVLYRVVAFDPESATNLGLSALPTSAVGTQGGDATIAIDGGTLQAATATTATLRAGALATNKAYDGAAILITSGTGAGQAPRTIAYYNGATKVATIHGSWPIVPDATSVYQIVSCGSTPIVDASGDLAVSATAASVGPPIALATIKLAASASSTDGAYNLMPIKIIAGTGAGSVAIITNYVGSTQTATIDRNWTFGTPDATSVYRIGLDHVLVDTLNQLAARFGSSGVSGNVITFTSPDGLHVYTLTSAPSLTAPTSETLAKVS